MISSSVWSQHNATPSLSVKRWYMNKYKRRNPEGNIVHIKIHCNLHVVKFLIISYSLYIRLVILLAINYASEHIQILSTICSCLCLQVCLTFIYTGNTYYIYKVFISQIYKVFSKTNLWIKDMYRAYKCKTLIFGCILLTVNRSKNTHSSKWKLQAHDISV